MMGNLTRSAVVCAKSNGTHKQVKIISTQLGHILLLTSVFLGHHDVVEMYFYLNGT